MNQKKKEQRRRIVVQKSAHPAKRIDRKMSDKTTRRRPHSDRGAECWSSILTGEEREQKSSLGGGRGSEKERIAPSMGDFSRPGGPFTN